MKKTDKNQRGKFNYNEPVLIIPNHQFARTQEFDLNKYPGIKARILIEKTFKSYEGVNTSKRDELKVSFKNHLSWH